MRGTGRGYGLRVDTWVDERRDPVKATDAAARHLRDLRERFGSLYLAAAAYNAGAGKVSRSLGKLQWEPVAEPPAEEEHGADVVELAPRRQSRGGG
jgi:soluble lytic murein transglycosylase-like protein